jgi:hypothetical protein
MSTILITGGTGLVGSALCRLLISKGHSIIILTRNAGNKETKENIEFAEWDVKKNHIDINAVQRSDHIIHLAGASVFDNRWSAAYKKEIEESRTLSSQLLVKTLKENSHSIKTVVSASAIGWYGADKTAGHMFKETDPSDSGFLGHTCQLWEDSIEPVQALGIRLVKIRIGIVLSNDGGFLAPIRKGLKFGMAAITGSGHQVVSWIHIEDLCRMFLYAIENKSMNGPYNAVAPQPVTMKLLVMKEAGLLRGNFFVPLHVPAFALRLALGERSIEALKSATVSCDQIKNEGFTFIYPGIEAALLALKKDASVKDPY